MAMTSLRAFDAALAGAGSSLLKEREDQLLLGHFKIAVGTLSSAILVLSSIPGPALAEAVTLRCRIGGPSYVIDTGSGTVQQVFQGQRTNATEVRITESSVSFVIDTPRLNHASIQIDRDTEQYRSTIYWYPDSGFSWSGTTQTDSGQCRKTTSGF